MKQFKKMKREERIRRGLAIIGHNPLADRQFRKQVTRDKTKYSRKGRAVTKQFVDGSFVYYRDEP